jgi:hypothetical protein
MAGRFDKDRAALVRFLQRRASGVDELLQQSEPEAQPTPDEPETPEERSERLNAEKRAQTPAGRMAAFLGKMAADRDEEQKARAAEQEQRLVEVKNYQQERLEYAKLRRSYDAARMTEDELKRFQELHPRHGIGSNRRGGDK